MAVIALTSASGSPGVTTTAVALAFLWPRPVVLVEADPTGGSAILAGYFRGTRGYDVGIVELALSALSPSDALREAIGLIPDTHVSLLAGTRSRTQAAALRDVWTPLAETLGQLKAFHDGKRLDATGRMPPMAMILSDEDMQDLAAYFAAQVPEGAEADPAHWQSGQKLFAGGDRARQIPACTACHGPAGQGVPTNGYPALRAQSVIYTVNQLNSYAAGTRYATDAKGASAGGSNAVIMQSIAKRLTADDIRDLAAYIQGLR